MKYINKILFSALLLCAFVACKDDDTADALPIVPNFEVSKEDGSKLSIEEGATNSLSVGTLLIFEDKSTGKPNNVSWTLKVGNATKTITAENGRAEYAVAIGGSYDLIFKADGTSIERDNFLLVEGSGEPIPEVVNLLSSFEMNGTTLENTPEARYKAMSANTVNIYDLSEGNSPTMKWTFTCEESGINDVLTFEDIPYGERINATYTFPKGGLYTVTQEAGGKTLVLTNLFEVTENKLYTIGYDIGLEGGDSNGKFVNLWWWPVDGTSITNTTDQAHSGSRSVCFEITLSNTDPTKRSLAAAFRDAAGADIAVPVSNGKTYEIGFWMYVESIGSQPTQIDFNLDGHAPLYGGISAVVLDPATLEKGVWKYYTVKVQAISDVAAPKIIMRAINNNAAQDAPFKFYLDDLTMTEVVEVVPEPDPVVLSFTATNAEGVELTNAAEAANEIALGSSVTFTNTSTGAPANVKWAISGITRAAINFELSPDASGTVTFKFAYEGDYGITMIADDAEAVSYTNYIKVVDKGITPEPEDPIVIPEGDMLSVVGYDYSFENIPTIGEWVNIGDTWGEWGVGYKEFTFSNSTDQAKSGKTSTFFSIETGKGMLASFRSPSAEILNIAATNGSTYAVTCWVYVKSMPTTMPASLRFSFNTQGEDVIDWGSTEAGFTFKPEHLNTWTKVSVSVPCKLDGDTELLLIGSGKDGDAPFEFYLDDLSMTAM